MLFQYQIQNMFHLLTFYYLYNFEHEKVVWLIRLYSINFYKDAYLIIH